ncbi:MAG: class I SAM-dependent methyltransferase [Gemmatimonadota bacterium]
MPAVQTRRKRTPRLNPPAPTALAGPRSTTVTKEIIPPDASILATPAEDGALQSGQALMEHLFGPAAEREFAIRYWDVAEEQPLGTTARFTLVIRCPEALRRALLPPSERKLGEAYVRGDLDIEGDLEEAAELAVIVRERLRSPSAVLGFLARVWALPSGSGARSGRGSEHSARWSARVRHSRRRDAAAISFHYDVGNDFYRLFLDDRMVYSCAYFPEGTEDLAAAQEAKLEHICRKLRLQPGERLLDIGSGWGALIQFAAERYSVNTVGITLSEAQARFARERIAAAGLTEQCRVEVRDYRDLPADTQFDKIASVGMVEHVGRRQLPVYFREAFRLLKPGGLFLNHGIVSLLPRESRLHNTLHHILPGSASFLERYVFPDGEILTPGELSDAAEAAGFEERDVESLREHYTLTLRHWVNRIEARESEAIAATDETTYRIWRLYMAGCANAFKDGRVGVVQTLLGKPRADGSLSLPLTRQDLYATSE